MCIDEPNGKDWQGRYMASYYFPPQPFSTDKLYCLFVLKGGEMNIVRFTLKPSKY